MKTFLAACFGTLLLFAAASAHAGPREALVVDAAWLAEHLADPELVLLHVGDAEGYAAGHIAGARRVELDDVSVSGHTRDGLMLEMPAADDLRERLQRLGISDDSLVVVYFGRDEVSPATRVVFTLQYAGLGARTRLLDGGLPAWVRAGGAVGTEVPDVRVGRLSPLALQDVLVDADYVDAHREGSQIALVDARAAMYYDGVERAGAHGQRDRAGHISGARSIPFTEVVDEQLQLRSQQELRELFRRAGIAPGDTVVGYCHIGQQATAMLLAARLLGHPVKLYDGSFQHWSRDEARAVTTSVPEMRP